MDPGRCLVWGIVIAKYQIRGRVPREIEGMLIGSRDMVRGRRRAIRR